MITIGEGRHRYVVYEKEDKIKLLEKGIWTMAQCAAYLGVPTWKLTPIFKKIKDNPPFKRCIYRDELLKYFNTSWEKEINLLKALDELKK